MRQRLRLVAPPALVQSAELSGVVRNQDEQSADALNDLIHRVSAIRPHSTSKRVHIDGPRKLGAGRIGEVNREVRSVGRALS
jgi:hypothetical protein